MLAVLAKPVVVDWRVEAAGVISDLDFWSFNEA